MKLRADGQVHQDGYHGFHAEIKVEKFVVEHGLKNQENQVVNCDISWNGLGVGIKKSVTF